jgi:hypothetical protein
VELLEGTERWGQQELAISMALLRKWDFPGVRKFVCIASRGDPLISSKEPAKNPAKNREPTVSAKSTLSSHF